MLNLDDLIVRGMEYFEFFKRTILETVQILQLIARYINEFQVWHTIQASSEITVIRARLDK